MSEYKPTIDIEPTDKYEKAKQDLITSYISFCELSPNQQKMLVNEIFGAANAVAVLEVLQRIFGYI